MNKYNYKYGELIEVTNNGKDWMQERFIGFTSDKQAVTEELEYGGIRIRGNCRPITKPELVPWEPEDITPCMRLRKKEWASAMWASPTFVQGGGEGGAICISGIYVTFRELLEEWETLDGKPCGKEAAHKVDPTEWIYIPDNEK